MSTPTPDSSVADSYENLDQRKELIAMSQAQLSDKQLNQLLTKLMGRRIRVGYRGGTPALHTGGGNADFTVGRVHLTPDYYRLVTSQRPQKGLPLALGILAHELGHHTDASRLAKGQINATGGIDNAAQVKAMEDAADVWAYDNLQRLAQTLGYKRRMAQLAAAAFKQYRTAHPYHG